MGSCIRKIAALPVLLLCLLATARADNVAPVATPAAAQPPVTELNTALVAQLNPILPSGMRLDSVTLGCDPPPNATLAEVAPGMTQLNSRSLMVVLAHDGLTLSCTATIAAERQVLVAGRDIAMGEAVAAGDFQPQWVEAFSAAPNALDKFPRTDTIAASPIRAGQPLYAYQLTRPVAIRPGDLVVVMIRNGPVILRAQLQSNSSASVGDNATVINPDTGAPVGVTVTGVKTAELVMP
jgi:flagella basal body P-ring formation protein FlgA